MRYSLLFPLLGLALIAQNPAPSRKPKVGSFAAATLEDPLVVEAKDYIQKQLAVLRIERITEASTQVVAGRNVRLLCRVKDEEGEGLWEFIAFRRLNGQWRLQLARRVGD